MSDNPQDTPTTPTGTVRVEWRGHYKLVGVKQEREIDGHVWAGNGSQPAVTEVPAEWWAAQSPKFRRDNELVEAKE